MIYRIVRNPLGPGEITMKVMIMHPQGVAHRLRPDHFAWPILELAGELFLRDYFFLVAT